ncbi:multiheme c-type cytochrome [Congregibacter brevis]|uniref:Multiheme c-type cytochrome n=1 Tax=Congregibacter brevis TaxID=3081201 RepID=A0ABZ0IEU9_9GAMM|nr:multiheme c-type cytochrome [Congregibacter sp. IMCC45268]
MRYHAGMKIFCISALAHGGSDNTLTAFKKSSDAIGCPGPMPLMDVLFTLLLALSLLFLPFASTTVGAAEPKDPSFVGTEECSGCHQGEHAKWQGSHHDLAMQKPTPETVLGDFDDASFEYFGVETQFLTRNGDYFVRTDGPDGQITEFPVAWVFGVDPLQQYLLPMEDGRLQALAVAWDTRDAKAGGQRWYHLFPDEEILYDDPLHWTGPYLNWNTRCAECHSTDVQKNYDGNTRKFATTFYEEDVGCEACHGPGSQHIALAQSGALSGTNPTGLQTDLSARGQWYFPDGESIARRKTTLNDHQQVDSCGRCHARRGTLGSYEHGKPLSDTHRLSLLGQPLYHHDGQILDEVYVYGSFMQSKMSQAGVVCANCHEPHSNQLRAEGNGVCAQCHKADVFDSSQHHNHPAGSAGAQCVNCHMPAQTYMGVDARRDHSMRIPRPDLSVMIGTPNACTECHDDQTSQWALDALRDWGTNFGTTSDHPAVAMAALQRGDSRAVPSLMALAGDESASPIWRATALEQVSSSGAQGTLQIAQSLLIADDPLLRISAVRATQQLPVARRYLALAPLIKDPVTGVRMEVAMSLAAVPLNELDGARQKSLLALFDEYKAVQKQHLDMPAINMQLGIFNATRGDFPAAESAYREALALNPQLMSAYLNLADLLRGQSRESEAKEQLKLALEVNPESGDAMHALGLLEARAGRRDSSLEWLAKAASVETVGSRHRFVYGVAQHDFGDIAGSLNTLRRLHAALPADEQVLLALVNYSAESGNTDNARRYAKKLIALAPRNPNYQQLAASLGLKL